MGLYVSEQFGEESVKYYFLMSKWWFKVRRCTFALYLFSAVCVCVDMFRSSLEFTVHLSICFYHPMGPMLSIFRVDFIFIEDNCLVFYACTLMGLSFFALVHICRALGSQELHVYCISFAYSYMSL